MSIPIILSTWSFGVIANRAGWPVLERGGSALDAVEAACAAVDLDESVDSVGIGGTPDAEGNVTLDGCVMLSPKQSAGVACVRRHANPVSIARKLMERTPHKLLVGEGADAFADRCGFASRNLLTEAGRKRWEELIRQKDAAARQALVEKFRRANREEMGAHDTVGVLAIDRAGVMAGACSTSGLPFKLPGRVGDSPIIGHGLYVEPGIGAAVTTGRGELMMGTCAAFFAVETMRRSASAEDAVHAVLDRLRASYELPPTDQCGLITLRPDGQWARGALKEGFKVVVTDSGGEQIDQVR